MQLILIKVSGKTAYLLGLMVCVAALTKSGTVEWSIYRNSTVFTFTGITTHDVSSLRKQNTYWMIGGMFDITCPFEGDFKILLLK